MKILTILTYYRPHWTGLTTCARRVAESLASRGHSVTVLTSRHSPSLPERERIDGVDVVRLNPAARVSRGVVCPSFPSAAMELIASHDLVHVYTPMMESLAVAAMCKLRGRPLVISHLGDLVMPQGLTNAVIERTVTGMMTAAARAASAITIPSRDYAEHSDFLMPFAEKLAYIYPVVELAPPSLEDARAWRARLGLTDHRVVGFAGRFVEEKGFDYLLQAIPRLAERDPSIHLVFAGEQNVGYERFYEACRPLVERHRDRITFLGLLSDPRELANFYAMCDVFTLPSRTDCFAVVQVESMLSGTPVVASDIPGARVVVKETGMGLLVKPGDPEAMADGLHEVLQHPARYHRTPAEIRSVFSSERTIEQHEELFARCIERYPAPVRRAPPASQSARVRRDRTDPFQGDFLTDADREILRVLLSNEADMAFRRRVPALLDYLELCDGDRVLDGGCGMGFYLLAMSRLRRLDLVGLDRDLGRLRWAEDEQVEACLVDGDVEHLPFADGSFDKVLLSEVLEHLENDRVGLSEAFRTLRPGGILAISVPHSRYPFLWDPINRLWTGVGGKPLREGPLAGIWSKHRRLYDVESLLCRVRGAGFEIEQAEELTHYSFPLIHFLVYGIGKPLLEHNLLPDSLRNSADRFRGGRSAGTGLNPIKLGVRAFRLVDSLNDRYPPRDKDTFVNILVKARRPPVARPPAIVGETGAVGRADD